MEKVVVVFLVFLGVACGYIVEPGPVVKATRGGVWPKPQKQEFYDGYYTFNPSFFKFRTTQQSCDLLDQAYQRYYEIIRRSGLQRHRDQKTLLKKFWKDDIMHLGTFDRLDVAVLERCNGTIYPEMNMDEQYILNITEGTLRANTIWGTLRGLETFSQLIHFASDDYTLVINNTAIEDFPRFSHRGLLIDTSRHYIPVYTLLQMLDAMEYNKMSVFHWHIVDDHSFPFQSLKFPELSNKGAFHPVYKVYTPKDVADIIEYARVRGIRVIPEFDTPGHTRSWGVGIPELLTPCEGQYKGKFGPLDPTRDFVYSFLQYLFSEVHERFPDRYVHLGGDEVEFECWASNSNINNFMANMNISGNYAALESYFIQKLVTITENLNYNNIVWEEVYSNKVNITKSTIVHIWKDAYRLLLNKVTQEGFYALLSSCWYLDHLSTGGDWEKYYKCEPLDFNGTEEQENLVLGGEACMWAESVNEFNIGSRIWPRASATAEKLWSSKDADTVGEAAKRLEEHTCRMNSRGIPAQPPNGPGVCLF